MDTAATPPQPVDTAAIAGQREHWAATFEANPDMYGTDPSAPALAAAEAFAAAGYHNVLELGAGQGRDTLYLARQGLQVTALEIVPGTGRDNLRQGTRGRPSQHGDRGRHDMREPLPLSDDRMMRPTPTCFSVWR